MNKINSNREYFVDPFSNLQLVFRTKYQAAVSGDLIKIFGVGHKSIHTETILSKLIKVMYA